MFSVETLKAMGFVKETTQPYWILEIGKVVSLQVQRMNDKELMTVRLVRNGVLMDQQDQVKSWGDIFLMVAVAYKTLGHKGGQRSVSGDKNFRKKSSPRFDRKRFPCNTCSSFNFVTPE